MGAAVQRVLSAQGWNHYGEDGVPRGAGPRHSEAAAEEHDQPVAESEAGVFQEEDLWPPFAQAEYEGHSLRLPPRTSSASAGVAADRGNWGPFTVYAASQAGIDHEIRGRYREDAYAISGSPDPSVVLLAVADGVSSAWAAHTAAGMAATHILYALREQTARSGPPTPETWSRRAAKATKETAQLLDPVGVRRRAATLGYSPPSRQAPAPPATTLAFAVCHHAPHSVEVYYGGVGDARVDVLDLGTRAWRPLYGREPGTDGQDNRTHALPRNPNALRTGSTRLRPQEVLALATDGFGKGLDAQPAVLAEEIAAMVTRPPKASDFLRLVDWKMSGNNDDRTVALAWRSRQPPTEA
jgi:serine/threonine protein phosphatase PrpC